MDDSLHNQDGDPLVDRIRRGDREAYKHLFRTYCEDLCRFALNYVEHLRVAEDLVQDVFFNLWDERHALEVEQSLKAYLYGMVRHRAITHLRKKQVRSKWMRNGNLQDLSSDTLADRSGDGLEYKEQKQGAKRAIEALSERQYQVFVLSRRYELTYSEIAVALDISIRTVETHMSRALKFLRDRLELTSKD
jgi:RNA polymerase sigma-70 factor (ECF subfamily)